MESWLDDELSGSVFKDERLAKRFKKITAALSNSSGKTIPQVCEEWGMTKSVYRFLDNDRVEEGDILAGHFLQTAKRITATEGPVLMLHDTSEFAYNRANPGAIGFTRKGKLPRESVAGHRLEYHVCGVLLHASLAVTPEGLPLGLASARFWTRHVFKNTRQMKRHINPTRIPIDEKESIRWLQNLDAVHSMPEDSPSKIIHIGDRENDIYEYFCKCFDLGTHFLVRACVNRLADEATISELIGAQSKAFNHRIEFIDGDGKDIAANLELKVRQVKLHPPIGKQDTYPDLNVTIVSAVEKDPPKNRDRIKWTFITNLPVTSKSQAVTVLDWYKQRWKIELYFKILKSGFKAEESRLRSADRLSKLISIFCILAWRIQWITMLNRDDNQTAPKIAFDRTERKILASYFRKKHPTPQSLQDYIILLARLGGYLGRASDPPPGITIIWRGIQKLCKLRVGFELAEDVGN